MTTPAENTSWKASFYGDAAGVINSPLKNMLKPALEKGVRSANVTSNPGTDPSSASEHQSWFAGVSFTNKGKAPKDTGEGGVSGPSHRWSVF